MFFVVKVSAIFVLSAVGLEFREWSPCADAHGVGVCRKY